MIRGREGIFEGVGGTVLRWRLWQPDAPRAAVYIIHGWGEHSGRYEVFAGALTGRGFAVFSYDQRGHGRSDGPRGHADRFEDLVEDLARARAEGEDRFAKRGLPTVLLGQSMGALVVLRALARSSDGLAGAVLSAPWLATAAPVPTGKRRLGEVLDRVWPSLGLPAGTGAESLTRDPVMIRAHREDPWNHSRMSPRLFFEVERAQRSVLGEPGPAGLPVLVLVPEADPLVDARVSVDYVEARASEGMELVRLAGLRHEPLNEVEREEIYGIIGSWINGILEKGAG